MLDGVAMSVPRRSTEPGRPPDALVDFNTGVDDLRLWERAACTAFLPACEGSVRKVCVPSFSRFLSALVSDQFALLRPINTSSTQGSVEVNFAHLTFNDGGAPSRFRVVLVALRVGTT